MAMPPPPAAASLSASRPPRPRSPRGGWAPGPPSHRWDVPEPCCPATTWCNRSNRRPVPKARVSTASAPLGPGSQEALAQGRAGLLSRHLGQRGHGFSRPGSSNVHAGVQQRPGGLAGSRPALKAHSRPSAGPGVVSVALGHLAPQSRALGPQLSRPLARTGGPALQTAGRLPGAQARGRGRPVCTSGPGCIRTEIGCKEQLALH